MCSGKTSPLVLAHPAWIDFDLQVTGRSEYLGLAFIMIFPNMDRSWIQEYLMPEYC